MTQTDLSRAMAATGDEWRKHGVQVVDSVTGNRWRRHNESWLRDSVTGLDDQWAAGPLEILATAPWLNDVIELRRAIAAGPDWQDDATAGVLFGLLIDFDVYCVHGVFYCHLSKGVTVARALFDSRQAFGEGATRNEAIARAYVASKGAM